MVRLVPMSQTEFEAYLESSVQDYAQEHVRTGNWSAEKALQMAEESFHKLLPDGLVTSNQYLFTVEDETLGQKVGVLWFAVEEREAGPRAFLSMMCRLTRPIVAGDTARRRLRPWKAKCENWV